jgi:hypothetical protein
MEGSEKGHDLDGVGAGSDAVFPGAACPAAVASAGAGRRFSVCAGKSRIRDGVNISCRLTNT